MERKEVKVPKRYKDDVAESWAYIDGYLAGYGDQVLNATVMGTMGELAVELVQHGTTRVMSARGLQGIADRTTKRLGKHATLARQLADAVKAVRKIGRKG